jgi:hypothetical protein
VDENWHSHLYVLVLFIAGGSGADKVGFCVGRFKRDSIPADLQGDAANPNPETWGAPVASWTDAACDIANEVKVG